MSTPITRLGQPTVLVLRRANERWRYASPALRRGFSRTTARHESSDPRIQKLGKQLVDEYALIRDRYETPKHPIVLAHGLLGFAELKLASNYIPPIHYWHGIKDALNAQQIEVITASMPPSGSIENRALKLGQDIAKRCQGKSVNIIAHSMGGLDARYMVSQLQPEGVDVKSLVTVATPHHGSAFADFLIDELLGPRILPRLYNLWERTTGWETGAFSQLTRKYMTEEFNRKCPDDPTVRYFSYGAMILGRPPLLSPFRLSHRVIERLEGPNDGLVSVESAKWGTYKGTLVGVNHLDLINWSNRIRYTFQKMLGHSRSFNAIAFYLDIADMLAKEGL
ncbi:Alpha/Beta hydrolase protein [Diplogelasinospora grovesii]|uniref:GPI inositol-deacylase n=1 Tax=Diplogelasinospora grovesii TaxID=303347 RepID=A0AAN6N4R6_9PEZI|nr:Alpha/Beta hydrolase protein [Diplogelasinospora grovesii]